MDYSVGDKLYIPLHKHYLEPIQGQTIKLTNYDLESASTTPTESYIEIDILETSSKVLRLDDDYEEDGVLVIEYLVQIQNYKIQEKETKFFLSDFDKKEKEDNRKIKYRIFGMEMSDKINLHDSINYAIFKSNKYEFRNGEFIIYFPELLVENVNTSKLHKLIRENFQITNQLVPLQITRLDS